MDNLFHMWHNTEFFSVHSKLYPSFHLGWSILAAPKHLFVSTPSVVAYVSAHWLPRGRIEVTAS